MEFHLYQFEGKWAVYQITGDQISDRVVRDKDGKITHRRPWPGYLGLAADLDEVKYIIMGIKDGHPFPEIPEKDLTNYFKSA